MARAEDGIHRKDGTCGRVASAVEPWVDVEGGRVVRGGVAMSVAFRLGVERGGEAVEPRRRGPDSMEF